MRGSDEDDLCSDENPKSLHALCRECRYCSPKLINEKSSLGLIKNILNFEEYADCLSRVRLSMTVILVSRFNCDFSILCLNNVSTLFVLPFRYAHFV